MLSSITPLGQRGRGMSWAKTLIAFWVGAIVAATLVFSAAAVVGAFLGLDRFNPWYSLGVLLVAGVLDFAQIRPPGPKRQVDENWLGRYRDWVVGLGYGFQLGLGFATIVPVFGTWALVLVAASLPLPVAGLMGVGFGAGRGVLLLTNRSVRSPSALSAAMRRFASAEVWGRRVALSAYGVVLVIGGVSVFI